MRVYGNRCTNPVPPGTAVILAGVTSSIPGELRSRLLFRRRDDRWDGKRADLHRDFACVETGTGASKYLGASSR